MVGRALTSCCQGFGEGNGAVPNYFKEGYGWIVPKSMIWWRSFEKVS